MDSWELYQYLSDLCPPIEVVDGLVFFNQTNLSAEDLKISIRKYKSISEAQKWINMVPVNDFFSNAISNWNTDDPNILAIISIYSKLWLAACARVGIDEDILHVSFLKDYETGDVIFRLEQKYPAARVL